MSHDITGKDVEWWLKAAVAHAEADLRCGRDWQCACGPCLAARRGGPKTYEDLLKYGGRKISTYEKALRGQS